MAIKINTLWGAVISLVISIIPEVIKRIFRDTAEKGLPTIWQTFSDEHKNEDREKILEYCLRECPLNRCLKQSCTLFPITGGRR